MSDQNQPVALPASPTAAVGPKKLPLINLGKSKSKWVLELHAEHLALYEENGSPPCIYLRAEVQEKMDFISSLRVLQVTYPRKIGFRMSRESMLALAAWMGPVVGGKTARNNRMIHSWTGLFGLIMLLGSWLPNAHPIQPYVGVALCVLWVLGKIKLYRQYLLLDAIAFLGVVVILLLRVWHGDRWWLMLAALFDAFLAFFAYTAYRNLCLLNASQNVPPSRPAAPDAA